MSLYSLIKEQNVIPITQGSTYEDTVTVNLVEVTANLTFSDSEKTITRDSGDFLDDGFLVGQKIYTEDSQNPGPFTATAVTPLAITVSETVVDATATAKRISTPYDLTGATAASKLVTLTGAAAATLTCVIAADPTTGEVARSISATDTGTLTPATSVTYVWGLQITKNGDILPEIQGGAIVSAGIV